MKWGLAPLRAPSVPVAPCFPPMSSTHRREPSSRSWVRKGPGCHSERKALSGFQAAVLGRQHRLPRLRDPGQRPGWMPGAYAEACGSLHSGVSLPTGWRWAPPYPIFLQQGQPSILLEPVRWRIKRPAPNSS